MTQFNNATFSVGGRYCDGCSQRDVWLAQRDKRIEDLEMVLEEACAYLSINKLTNIMSGSPMHKAFIDVLDKP